MARLPTMVSRPTVNLETVVRPFYKAAPKPDRSRVDNSTPDVEDNPVLSWSARGSNTVIEISGFGIRYDAFEQEIDRQVHVERVTNPEDPSQYVDVEVIDTIDFRDDRTGDRRQLRLNNGG